MSIKSITILGARGMLGSDLVDVAAQRGLEVQAYDLPEFDMTDSRKLSDVVSKSHVIVNCAAYTNVEKAQSEIEIANQVNGYSVGRLGALAQEAGIPVVHISTDFVFDGIKQAPYVETDPVNPLSVYGSSKYLGEILLAESGCQHCIVRVQWTYGKSGTNFIKKITAAADQRDELKVVDDQVGSPTHTLELAQVLCELIGLETFPTGIYHCAASGYVSRYDMTCHLFRRLDINTKLLPCSTSEFKTMAKRPLNSRFDCTKLQTLLKRTLPTWQQMLDNYLEAL